MIRIHNVLVKRESFTPHLTNPLKYKWWTETEITEILLFLGDMAERGEMPTENILHMTDVEDLKNRFPVPSRSQTDADMPALTSDEDRRPHVDMSQLMKQCLDSGKMPTGQRNPIGDM